MYEWTNRKDRWRAFLKEATRRNRRANTRAKLHDAAMAIYPDDVIFKQKAKEYGDPWSWD